jgi:conjugal transfer pilus assembly protein TraV
MHLSSRLLAAAPLILALSACVSFGSNVKGQFSCRAPKGECAPSRVIDDRATHELSVGQEPYDLGRARVRAGIVEPAGSSAPQRTGERTLRIVFPAHVDEVGTLHDEAVAWAVVEAPQWSAEHGARSTPSAATPIARQVSRQLKAAHNAVALPAQIDPADEASLPTAASTPPSDSAPLFELASPPALPSTVGEAITGAPAPVAEGSDMAATPHDRTPRSFVPEPTYPSTAAIDAAHHKTGAHADPATAPASGPATAPTNTPLPKEPQP